MDLDFLPSLTLGVCILDTATICPIIVAQEELYSVPAKFRCVSFVFVMQYRSRRGEHGSMKSRIAVLPSRNAADAIDSGG